MHKLRLQFNSVKPEMQMKIIILHQGQKFWLFNTVTEIPIVQKCQFKGSLSETGQRKSYQ